MYGHTLYNTWDLLKSYIFHYLLLEMSNKIWFRLKKSNHKSLSFDLERNRRINPVNGDISRKNLKLAMTGVLRSKLYHFKYPDS